jgi:hypothetical protein
MKLRHLRPVVLLSMATCFVAAFAFAQGKPPKKPPTRPPTTAKDGGVAGAGTHEAPPPPAPTASPDAGVVEAKTLDGGTRVFKFGEVEIEGRLRSPQIVYFLRRVRAEFAAGDLGHRSFMGELSDTRHTPNF